MISIDTYINLAGETIPSTFPRAYLFSTNDIDYSIPYTRRYFVKKINDSDIIEVQGDNFKSLPPNIYQKSNISWQISGVQHSVIRNGQVVQEGAYEYNQRQAKLAERYMPGLTQKVSGNYLIGFKQS